MSDRERAERTVKRGSLTKAVKAAQAYLQAEDVRREDLLSHTHIITDYRSQLERLNEKIQDTLSDAELKPDLERAEDYDESAVDMIANLNAAVQRFEAIATQETTAAAVTQAVTAAAQALAAAPASVQAAVNGQSETASYARLPKLSMVKFSGSPLHWDEFWDDFTGTVDERKDLTKVSKFKYLKRCLSGDALRVAEGFRLTDANYDVVKHALKDRYGDEDVAIYAHFEALLELPRSNQQIDQLRATYDKCEAHIRSLVALGQTEDTFGRVYVQIILKKLPIRVQEELHRKNGSGNRWTLANLRKLLRDEIEAREKAESAFKGSDDKPGNGQGSNRNGQSGGNKWQPNGRNRSTASTFFSSASRQGGKQGGQDPKGKSSSAIPNCAFCNEVHFSSSCQKVTGASSRIAKVQENKLCYTCLGTDHQVKDCKSKERPCRWCKKSGHHSSLCITKYGQQSITPSNTGTTAFASAILNPNAAEFRPVDKDENTLSINTLGIRAVMGHVANSANNNRVFCLIMGQRGPMLQKGRFNENQRKSITRDVVALDIFDIAGRKRTLELCVVNFISAPIQLYPLNVADSNIVQTLKLAEPLVKRPTLVDVDILLGLDYYHDFIGDEKIRCPNGLVLMDSCVGYVASGKIPGPADNTRHETMFLSAIPDAVQQHTPIDLEKFWSIEEIGIKDSPEASDDDLAMQKFNATVKFEDNRYQVCWPFKTETPELPTNYGLALGRLNSLYKRLQSDQNLLQRYHQTITEQIDKGITERAPRVPNGLVHYIPHHAVVTPQKATTKVRVVYDASAKSSKDALSINECLHRGPIILKDLVGLLLRFRPHHIAIVSDVEKAFLQIGLQPDQRDVTRFLWLKDPSLPPTKDNIEVYRFCRVAFGYNCSPFLLAACILHLLQRAGTAVAKSIERNLYVDNVLGGAETTEEAIEYYNQSVQLFASASMNLREWYSNNKEFLQNVSDHHRGAGTSTKVLGLTWDTEKDILGCTVGKAASAQVSTKRQLLQALASVYDPCGYFTPVTVTAKMIMQDIWKNGSGWDEKLPEETLQQWTSCQENLCQIPQIEMPRNMKQSVFTVDANVQLHCFCDASAKAYATAVYIRIETPATCTVDLLASKSRVAPLKTELKIPKLELVAVLIGTRLLNFIRKELPIDIANCVIWSDSECALQWIRQEEPKEVFVRNRVREIRTTPDATFRYVRTAENPADMPTRGITATELAHSVTWWNGPEWLLLPPDSWPIHKLLPFKVETQSSENDKDPTVNETACVAPAEPNIPGLLDTGQFSSLRRLHRITALVQKFIALLRKQTDQRTLTAQDIERSREYWIRTVQMQNYKELLSRNKLDKGWQQFHNQLAIFVDPAGILRCRGRLGNAAAYEENNVILLPKNTQYTWLVIQDCHEQVLHFKTKHTLARVRERYWIPHGREQVKKVVKACKHCHRFTAGAYVPPDPPDLPQSRLAMARPFSRVGLDYIGPLYVRSADIAKVWICLFTCATTRAIYLDLVSSLTTEDFILCLRRFAATYGIPKMIICDNAKQFHAGERLLVRIFRDAQVGQYATNHGIEWKFITELAPWMGGFYERLVKPVKDAVKSTLNRKLVSVTELHTVIMEVSAVINSRPLVYSEAEVGDEALTPAHFLMKAASTWPNLPAEDEYLPTRGSTLVVQWKRIQNVLDTFWQSWKSQYLRSLREHHSKPNTKGVHINPEVGTVVQIADPQPRGLWRLGRIARLIPSADGKVRSVEVRLANGHTIRRAIRQLHPLECSSDKVPGNTEADEQANDMDVTITRPKRPQRAANVAARRAIRLGFASETDSDSDKE